jgi:predicted enzyme related to lactoylglutathione lyase
MPIQISGMTLAATSVEAMVAFYNAVLDAHFEVVELFPGATGYRGKLAGMDVLMCPNTVARVDARQNRQQFDFLVDDVRATVAAALAHGGKEISPIYEQNGVLIGSVYDPDGNSMVFKQKI